MADRAPVGIGFGNDGDAGHFKNVSLELLELIDFMTPDADFFVVAAPGLALGPDEETLYVAVRVETFRRGPGQSGLVTVDTTSGETTPIGGMDPKISSLAFLMDGTLVGASPPENSLFDIDPAHATSSFRNASAWSEPDSSRPPSTCRRRLRRDSTST